MRAGKKLSSFAQLTIIQSKPEIVTRDITDKQEYNTLKKSG